MSRGGPRIARRLVAYLVATAALGSCAREPVAPASDPIRAPSHTVRSAAAPPVSVATLLDSFAIGGVYTVLPRGGFTGRYARSPEKEHYAGTVFTHPTGIELPVGLPVRILAEGSYTARATAAFLSEYCASYGAKDPRCPFGAFSYSVHGLAPGPGVLHEYESGTGLQVAWSQTAGFSERFWATHPSAEFFRGVVPASDTAASRELHFRRAGCCYYIPLGSAAWETYEGSWRFGAVPDDGGRAELGEAAVLRLLGPRTDSAMVAPAMFRVTTTGGDALTATRWWFVRAANNTFDGEPVPMITLVMPWGTIEVPRYPDGQQTAFEELPACAGQTTCPYQATTAGAVVVQATLADGRVFAARNTGTSAITIDLTMIGGDSIVPSGTRVSNIRPVTRMVEVRARTASGAPVSDREVTLRVVTDSLQSGGHSHRQQLGLLSLRPTGRFAIGTDTTVTTTVVTGADGRARATYIAPVVGGTEVLWATSTGSDSVHRRLVLAVPGIVAAADTSVHYFMEPTRNHSPGHNYAHVGVMEKVDSLLGRYKALHQGNPARFPFDGANGARFRVSAVGLPRGGLYDVNGQWTPVPDGHQWHREGLEVDVNDRGNGQGAESARGQDAMFALCRTDVAAAQYRPRKCIYHLGHYHITYPGVFR